MPSLGQSPIWRTDNVVIAVTNAGRLRALRAASRIRCPRSCGLKQKQISFSRFPQRKRFQFTHTFVIAQFGSTSTQARWTETVEEFIGYLASAFRGQRTEDGIYTGMNDLRKLQIPPCLDVEIAPKVLPFGYMRRE